MECSVGCARASFPESPDSVDSSESYNPLISLSETDSRSFFAVLGELECCPDVDVDSDLTIAI